MRLQLRLTSASPVSSLASALEIYGRGDFLSAWSGPALAEAQQPTLVGVNAAVAAVFHADNFQVLVNPSQQLLLTHLSQDTAYAPPTVFPQFAAVTTFLNQLETSFTADSVAVTDFTAATGCHAPLSLFSLGFTSATPGVVVIPQRLFAQFAQQAWLIEVAAVNEVPLPQLPAALQLSESTENTATSNTTESLKQPDYTLTDSSGPAFTFAVAALTQLLQAGRAQKTVLARKVQVRANAPHSLSRILSSLSVSYPSCWQFAVAGLAGATPEMLAAVSHGRVFSRVLAGTCVPGEEAALASSEKNLSEHSLAAASVSQALQPICADLQRSNEPFILRLPNVSHLATDFSGQLLKNSEGGGVMVSLARMHPTAAVCGTPTVEAFKLIANFEGNQRGRYAGPVGWLDAQGAGAGGLALRCGQLQIDPQVMELYAGCGIMPSSDPQAELAETKAKLRPMLEVFGW